MENNVPFFTGRKKDKQERIVQLDKIDKKIIALISINARFSCTTIAKIIGISREQTAYRMGRLEQQQIYNGTFTLLNSKAFQKNVYEVYLRLRKLGELQRKGTTQYFVQHSKTQWVATTGGAWDYALTIVASTIEEADEIITEFKKFLQDNIQSIRIHPILSEEYTWKPYLTEVFTREQAEKYLSWKGKNDGSNQKQFSRLTAKKQILDEQDYFLLRLLEHDARIPIKEISRQTKLAYETVQKRIKEFIQYKTIQRFIPLISASALNFQWNLALLNVNTANKERVKQFEQALKNIPEVAYIARVLGTEATHVISIMARDGKEYNSILNNIRTAYTDIIQGFESMMIFESYKYSSASFLYGGYEYSYKSNSRRTLSKRKSFSSTAKDIF